MKVWTKLTPLKAKFNFHLLFVTSFLGPLFFLFPSHSFLPSLTPRKGKKRDPRDKVVLSVTSTKVNTPTNHSSRKQRNEPIRISWNYLKLAQAAGKIARTRCDWFWLKNWREIFKPITKRRNRNCEMTFDSHLKTARWSMSLTCVTQRRPTASNTTQMTNTISSLKRVKADEYCWIIHEASTSTLPN